MVAKPDAVWDVNSKKYVLTREPPVNADEHSAVFTASGPDGYYYVKLFDYSSVSELDTFYEKLALCSKICKNYIVPFIPLKPSFMGYVFRRSDNMRGFSELKNAKLRQRFLGLIQLAGVLNELDKLGFSVCGGDENIFVVVEKRIILINSPELLYRKGSFCTEPGIVLQRAPEAACEYGRVAGWQEFSYAFALMVCNYLADSPSYYDIEAAKEELDNLAESVSPAIPLDEVFEFEDETEAVEVEITEEQTEESDEERLERLIFENKAANIFDDGASLSAREKGNVIEFISKKLKQLIISAMNADTVHTLRPDYNEWCEALKECYLNMVICRECGFNYFYDQNSFCSRCGTKISGILSLRVYEVFDVSKFNNTIWYKYEKRSPLAELSASRFTRIIECDGKEIPVFGRDIGLNGNISRVISIAYSGGDVSITNLIDADIAKVRYHTDKIDLLTKDKAVRIPIISDTLNTTTLFLKIGKQAYRFVLQVF